METSLNTIVEERFKYLFEAELLAEIASSGQFKTVSEGDFLMTIGQKITHMPLILSGSLKVMTEDEKGDDLLLYYLELGDTCAMTFSCCAKETNSSINVIAEEKSEMLLIPIENMELWMAKYSSWRNFVLESYNSRFNEMLTSIDSLAFDNMDQRLKKYLRDKAMIARGADLIITHADIANDLHSSRVVISRLMKKLEIEGIIKQRRNLVEVLEFKG
jgi:CRP/FNR family transcriptional regulator